MTDHDSPHRSHMPAAAPIPAIRQPRDRIVAAAMSCFARLGFHGASMQDICAEAGMSAGNLYRYFRSKEAIIAAIAEIERERNNQALALLEEHEDPVEGMKALARFFGSQMADPVMAALCAETLAEAIRKPEIRAIFDTNIADAHGAIARALRRGIASGHVDPQIDVDMVVRLLMAMGDGLTAHASMAAFMTPDRIEATVSLLLDKFLRPRGTSLEPFP
jgi:TetR/AcrR family transcriptional regulator, repressor for uid operon